jgi:hypothetical protein
MHPWIRVNTERLSDRNSQDLLYFFGNCSVESTRISVETSRTYDYMLFLPCSFVTVGLQVDHLVVVFVRR